MTGPYKNPTGLGSKDRSGPETSRAAAENHADGLREIRELVFEKIEEAGADGLTADEAAALLDLDVLSVRPRVSELKDEGRVGPNGQRRPNIKQNMQAVLVAAAFLPAAEGDAADREPVQGDLL